jgi:hypothetical protein
MSLLKDWVSRDALELAPWLKNIERQPLESNTAQSGTCGDLTMYGPSPGTSVIKFPA